MENRQIFDYHMLHAHYGTFFSDIFYFIFAHKVLFMYISNYVIY